MRRADHDDRPAYVLIALSILCFQRTRVPLKSSTPHGPGTRDWQYWGLATVPLLMTMGYFSESSEILESPDCIICILRAIAVYSSTHLGYSPFLVVRHVCPLSESGPSFISHFQVTCKIKKAPLLPSRRFYTPSDSFFSH
jgi:hypothetical protein